MDYYQEIIDYVKAKGKELVANSGKVVDIGVTKDWLTKQDIEIERDLVSIVAKLEGEHKVFAEEENNMFQAADNIWIIDPISATFNYIHGLYHYAIVISHVRNGEIQFGLVYDPSVDELFTAMKGRGTYLNGQRCYVNSQQMAKPPILFKVSELSETYKDVNLQILSNLLDIGPVKDIGSYGVHYAYVACGRVQAVVHRLKDAFPEFAGKILVEEAGGKFTDLQGNAFDHKTRGVVVTNGLLHDKVLTAMKDISLV